MHNLPFDYRKAVQAINYFARANGGVITKLDVLSSFSFLIAITCANTGVR